jgi:DNA repair photolyase
LKIVKVYKPRSILNTHKYVDGGWFWTKYSAFPYIGCQWGCYYCYWRDEKYNPHKNVNDSEILKFDDPFSQYIKVKENAAKLLRRALEKKPRDLIYLDSYQPVNLSYDYNREMLKTCLDLNFPVFINEKSPLLLRDLDILKEISQRSYLNVGWSIITTKDDKIRLAFEARAPSVKSRFAAMKKLAENNILTGTIFMPILPFIYDNEENIEAVIRKTKECGGKYVLDAGLTLWGSCKTYFYKALERYNSDLISEYEKLYRKQSSVAKRTAQTHKLVLKYCEKYNLKAYIQRPVGIYPQELQINKKLAEKFYLKAREIQLSGDHSYKEQAYRRAAWTLDELDKSLEEIIKVQGVEGVLKLRGVGKSLANQIIALLDN